MKTADFQGLKVRIDRPRGFVQEGKDEAGKPWKRTYRYDYGFLPKTKGGDGAGVDVFLGPDKNATEAYWVIQQKGDGSFDEYKVLLGFPSRAAAKKAYGEHVPLKYFRSMVAMSMEMIKALLGVEPFEKVAQQVAFLEELDRIAAGSR